MEPMSRPRSISKTVAVALLLGCIASFAGRCNYEPPYRQEVNAQYMARGLFVSFTVPGGWEWCGLDVAVVALGMVAWRFWGWATPAMVFSLCTLGAVEIDRILKQAEGDRQRAVGIEPEHFFHPAASQKFAFWGGLVSGTVAAVGLSLANLRTPRDRWNLRHLFVLMLGVACLLGALKIYEWRWRAENREFFAQMGSWPPGWQMTDADRLLHKEWLRQHGDE